MFNPILYKKEANTSWDWSPLQISKRGDGTYSVYNPMDQKTKTGFLTAVEAQGWAFSVAKHMRGE